MRQMLREFWSLFDRSDEPWFTLAFIYVLATDLVFLFHATGLVVLPHG